MKINVWNQTYPQPTPVERLTLRLLTLIALATLGFTMWHVGVPWWGVGLHLLSMTIFMNIWFVEGMRRMPQPDYVFDSPEALEALARVMQQNRDGHQD